MEVKTKVDLMLKGVPADVAAELDRRADAHFRSRTGEILSILTMVCRNKIALVEPTDVVLGEGRTDLVVIDDAGAAQDGAQSTGDGKGGESCR